MSLPEIRDALDRLMAAHQANDADGIEAASRTLDELGYAALALEAVDGAKRDAIDLLSRAGWTTERVAAAVSLSSTLTESVMRAEHERRDGPVVRRRNPTRIALESVACSYCKAPPGYPCMTRNGTRADPGHDARMRLLNERGTR